MLISKRNPLPVRFPAQRADNPRDSGKKKLFGVDKITY